MKNRWLPILFFLILLGPHESKAAAEIASIEHDCGNIKYLSDKIKLADVEVKTVRELLSYLYKGGRVVFSYPGAPPVAINNASKKLAVDPDHNYSILYNLKSKNIENPTKEQLEDELSRMHSLNPVGLHIHEGPSSDQIKSSIADNTFTKRAGEDLIKLIKNRLDGKTGNREKIINELKKRFGIKVSDNLQGDENCHIGEDLGLD